MIGYLNLLAFVVGYFVIVMAVASCVFRICEAAFYGIVMTRLALAAFPEFTPRQRLEVIVKYPFMQAWARLYGADRFFTGCTMRNASWNGGWKITVKEESK